MRAYLVFASLLLPLVGWAQLFNRFEPGTYVLAAEPGVTHAADLKLRDNGKLLVRDKAGNTQKLSPKQLVSFRWGKEKYCTVSSFHIPNALGGFDVEQGFAEQVDSGRVMLLRYTYQIGSGMTMGAGGMMTGGGGSSNTIYLLQWAGQPQITAVRESVKRVQEALRPYLADRPDLLTQLDEKRLTLDFLPAVIYALNRNQPYTSPLPPR